MTHVASFLTFSVLPKRASIQGFCVSKTHGIGRFFGGTSGHKTSELLDVSKAEKV